MELFFREMGEGPDVMILHGLFGSSDNWQSFARELSSQGVHVITVDLRNHGQSPHAPDFNYQVLADDVASLIEKVCEGSVFLIGHSMGGKTAMKVAETRPRLVSKLMVIDIAPRYYPPHHQQILAALKAVNPASLKTRGEAERILSDQIQETGTRQFLLKNLYWKNKETLAWRFNLDAIEKNIEAVGAATIPASKVMVPVVFVAGEHSGYIHASDRSEILDHFPNAEIITAPNAGHWVHADVPEWLLNEVRSRLS